MNRKPFLLCIHWIPWIVPTLLISFSLNRIFFSFNFGNVKGTECVCMILICQFVLCFHYLRICWVNSVLEGSDHVKDVVWIRRTSCSVYGEDWIVFGKESSATITFGCCSSEGALIARTTRNEFRGIWIVDCFISWIKSMWNWLVRSFYQFHIEYL